MNKALIDILVCPACNGKLKLTKDSKQLICTFDKLAYSVNDGIPNLLIDAAEKVSGDDIDNMELS